MVSKNWKIFYQKKYYPDILVTSMRKSTAEDGRMGIVCVHVAIKMWWVQHYSPPSSSCDYLQCICILIYTMYIIYVVSFLFCMQNICSNIKNKELLVCHKHFSWSRMSKWMEKGELLISIHILQKSTHRYFFFYYLLYYMLLFHLF